jgi:hypothetical protein
VTTESAPTPGAEQHSEHELEELKTQVRALQELETDA